MEDVKLRSSFETFYLGILYSCENGQRCPAEKHSQTYYDFENNNSDNLNTDLSDARAKVRLRDRYCSMHPRMQCAIVIVGANW